jgi:cytosolic carboxypeptidase protein 2/3
MQILLFSSADAKQGQGDWRRVGHHITYSECKQRTQNSFMDRDVSYYELDFQLVRDYDVHSLSPSSSACADQEFAHSGDTCYIAHCYPYTFTDLKHDLDHLSMTRPCEIFRRDILCESLAGNACFIITVTDECR